MNVLMVTGYLRTTILYVFVGIAVILDLYVTRPMVFVVYKLMTVFMTNCYIMVGYQAHLWDISGRTQT